MPYLDQTTLAYPATGTFPGSRWIDTRNPTSSDYKNFEISTIWINQAGLSSWIMVGRTATSGTWIEMATSGTGVLMLTGNTGGAISPNMSNNMNIIGSGALTVTGTPMTNTLTISESGAVATSYVEDSGVAVPVGGILNIVGIGGLQTSGSGAFVSIGTNGSLASQFVTDSGTATTAGETIFISGGTGVTTSGAGNIVTINAASSVATTFAADSGTATPASNIIHVSGGSTGLTTLGSGSTVSLAGTLNVAYGGTGDTTFTTYAPVCGGTTTTGALQSAATGIATAGFVLTSNGSSVLPSWQSVSLGAFAVNIQIFTTSGTYTPTAGMSYCTIEMVGGGGAGGGAAMTGASNISLGAGAGAGEYAKGVFSAATIGASQTVTIGAAGTANTGSAGGNGGNTSVGTLISAFGGIGGNTAASGSASAAAGSPGGTGGSGGSYRYQGQFGGGSNGSYLLFFFGGAGGNSPFGAGGQDVLAARPAVPGVSALGYGAGGGAAVSYDAEPAQAGGAGSAGLVVITEYIV